MSIYVELVNVKIEGSSKEVPNYKDAYISEAYWPLGAKLNAEELYEINIDTELREMYIYEFVSNL